MLVLNQRDVTALLTMEKCVGLMAETLSALARGEATLPLRTVFGIPDGAFAVMPAALANPSTVGAKIITVLPKNHGTEFDSHQGAVLLFDTANGSLLSVMDATSITTIRTAAVSGVATRALAKKDARTLAILGAGVQGHSHLDAMFAVRKFDSVRIWSRNTDHARALADVAREKHGARADVSATARDAVTAADVICTTTSATEPVLFGEWLSPGAHVNAVGTSQPHARELDSAVVVRSRLYVDRRESALKEPGDILTPIKNGEIGPDHIIAEVGEVLTGKAPGRRSDSDITLFKSLGLAIEDLASAQFLYTEALRTNTGVHVELGGARSAAH
jgi:ornithine cyclodeaminase/alanine dehydrogenase-like protein (mu-crystallin family)